MDEIQRLTLSARMIPLLLVAGLFIYLSFVGQALISLFKPRLGILWSWFAAPTVGLAVVLIVITRLSVWGIPIRIAGPWMTLGLLIGSAGVFYWRRPVLPLRKLAPFLIIAAATIIYVGWPALGIWLQLDFLRQRRHGQLLPGGGTVPPARLLWTSRSRPTWRAGTTPSTTGSCMRSSRSGPDRR